MMMKYVMLFASTTLTVLASTLLKLGGRDVSFGSSLLSIALGYLTSPLIVCGFIAYALAAFLWIYCLSQFDLSYVTFVSSIQYVLIVLVSIFIFREQITAMKWAGCALIMLGVVLYMKEG